MPHRLRRLLYRSFHFLPHSRDARGKTGGGPLSSTEPREPLPPLWKAGTTGGMHPVAAEPGDVRKYLRRGHGLPFRAGAGNPPGTESLILSGGRSVLLRQKLCPQSPPRRSVIMEREKKLRKGCAKDGPSVSGKGVFPDVAILLKAGSR